MLRFFITRLLQIPIAMLGMTLIVFVFMTASGDPATLMLPPEATQEELQDLRVRMGFDRPILEQYARFVLNAAQGDFGMSFRKREPAFAVVLQHLPATLELAAASLLIATVISIPLGIAAAVKRGSLIDTAAMAVAVLGQSMPVFWLGILLIYLFALTLNWLPVGGRGTFAHLILPALALGWYMNAVMTRVVRSTMLEILGQNYVRTARAKGLSEYKVILKHALKNAQVPIITIWGLQAGTLLTGTVVAETVFSWPGLARAAIYAVLGRDYPVVMASVLLFAFIFIIINFLVDLAYFWIDPRIREP